MDFDIFGSIMRRSQSLGQIFGNQIAGHRNDGCMPNCAIGINSYICCASADIDDAYTKVFFILSQYGLTACQRLQHHFIHL